MEELELIFRILDYAIVISIVVIVYNKLTSIDIKLKNLNDSMNTLIIICSQHGEE